MAILNSFVPLIAIEAEEVIPEAELMENSLYKIKCRDIKLLFTLSYQQTYPK